MGKTLTQKVLEPHIIEGEYASGKEIGIRIDQTLTQDATGTMAYLQFESMGLKKVKTSSVSYIDHNTIQSGFENADDHKYLKTIAAKYGIKLSLAGNGICHQVHLERFAVPGRTLLGSDSHTPTCGGIGMIAIGAGGLDVAIAMGGGPFYLTCPKICRVNLTGKLNPWVSAKDVILKVLEKFTSKGNVGFVFEYAGNGLENLTVPERATIANMGAECGITTSIFPSDENTRKFLKAQDRENDWSELKADNGAEYDKEITINMSEIEPMVAKPHNPDNVCKVSDIEGMKVDQIMIGSCTNSSYRDMEIVANILKGKRIHHDVSVGVACGSRQVLKMLADSGSLSSLLESGVRILECACGFCIGNSQSPQTNAVSLRTSNRNFRNRSGTKEASLYLVSPETAAVSALKGKITDPRNAGMEYPDIKFPERFIIDDTMILEPDKDPDSVKIYRGPNIGEPPKNGKMPDTISGVAVIKVGDKITTDHIMPAGPYMKFRSNVPKYAEVVFKDVDKDFYTNTESNKKSSIHNIIVAGLSYGQGSSREHAALCPMYLGVKAVIAKSIERIHEANLVNFGIIPLKFENESDYDKIEKNDKLTISDIGKNLEAGGKITLKNETKGIEIPLSNSLSERAVKIVLLGGLLDYTVGGRDNG
jgi:aconitate hydratase